ncbi:MAG: phosphatase PAP2 family protein [Sphingomicrobium sp.]
MAVVSILLVWQLHLAKQHIRIPYLSAAFSLLPIVMVLWAGVSLAQLIVAGNDKPIREMWTRLRYHGPMMILAAVIFPLFLAAYTICKSSIPVLVGFGWDQALSHADLELLDTDAWRLTHQWVGPQGTAFLQTIYAIVWGVALAFVGPLIAMIASRRFAGQYYLAMILTWTLGGIICATLFASAGPVFAQLSDPLVGQHFAGLQQTLARSLPPDNMIPESQHYLLIATRDRFVIKGGGISAMPSMHVAVASIYVLASRRTLFAGPAILFWALVLIASVHFGYHYFVDGIAGTLVAVTCWCLSRWWFDKSHSCVRAS